VLSYIHEYRRIKMAEIPTVYTVDEVAQLLKVNTQAIVDEINAGHLGAFRVGNEWRTTDKKIAEFISRGGSQEQGEQADRQSILPDTAVALERVEAFSHKWPDGTIEKYDEAYEGAIKAGSAQIQAKIGIGERSVAGKTRKRVVVFMDGRPTVEFAGVDDFDKSGLVASVVTLRNRKRLKPGQRVPDEYRHFRLVRYNTVLTGPRAMSVMAVLAKINDYDTMISHALIRAMFRDQQ
jgi:excisionase family DNA binding protein